MKNRVIGTIMLFTTAIIWGATMVAQVLGGYHVGPFTFNGLRFLLGSLTLAPVYLFMERERELTKEQRHKRHRKSFLIACVCGSMLYIASFLQQYGATVTRDPATTAFISGLYTVLTPILYWLIFHKKTSRNTWIGCGLAVIGLYLLSWREGGHLHIGIGEVVTLLGAIFWAGHILMVDHFVDQVSTLRFSSGQFFVCGVLGCISAAITEDFTWPTIRAGIWPIVFCGVLSVGVAFTLQVLGQQRAQQPTYSAIILSTESIFATISGLLWNQMVPESLQVSMEILPVGYVGCAIMFIGVVVSQLPNRRSLTAAVRKRNKGK